MTTQTTCPREPAPPAAGPDAPARAAAPPEAHPLAAVPVFIFGVPRSGTTYTFNLLNEHPRIRMTSEGRTVREGAYLYGRHGRGHDPAHFEQLLEAFCQAEGDEPLNRWLVRQIRAHGRSFYERHGRAGDFALLVRDLYTYRQNVACWGDKNVHVTECPNVLHLWPDARCVILIRDPRAVSASMAAYFGTRIKYAALCWNLHARWTRLHATCPQRFHVVRYEDLVTDTPAHLETIFRWLGVWDPAAAARILEKCPPQTASLDKWREALDGEQVRRLESYCFDEMRAWGYAPGHATHRVSITPIGRGIEAVREHARRIELDPRWWLRKRIVNRFFRLIRG